MRYILRTIPVGPIEANCYILGCARTREALVIDPGAEDAVIKKRLKEDGLTAKSVVNTHGHGDHIGANAKMELPVYIHKADAQMLVNPVKNASLMTGMPVTSPPAAKLLEDGDKINAGDLLLEVIHTPGHTPGSICLKVDDILFTGDTLFAEGVGRTDLPGGSETELMRSIKEKLLVLPDTTKIYPGHGPATTIGLWKNS